MNSPNSFAQLHRSTLFAALASTLCVFLAMCLIHVWIVDDAYITLRQVRNLVEGNGFVWNLGERVQTYTHPLWAMLLAVVYAITHEGYWTLTLLSLLVTFIGLGVAVRILYRGGEGWRALVFLALLLPSKAFFDYTSSGLENCLTHTLIFVFFGCLWQFENGHATMTLHRHKMMFVSLMLLASAIYLNRADTLALVAPALLLVGYRSWSKFGVTVFRWILAGGMPVLMWTLWTLFYYGQIVPNTAIAKIVGARLSWGERLQAGALYFFDSLQRDPYTLIFIIVTIILLFSHKRPTARCAALGLLAYLFYVFCVGAAGTHMSGRFFSGVVALSAFALAREWEGWKRLSPGALYGTVLAVSFISPHSPLRAAWTDSQSQSAGYNYNGIIDTRFHAGKGTSFSSFIRNSSMPDHPWYKAGLQYKRSAEHTHVGGLGAADAVGFSAFAAGPDKFIIDRMALTDPLLAHLPLPANKRFFRPGHVARELPEGYFESCDSGENQIQDPDLKEYYEVIREITRGPLWSWQRLQRIAELHLGVHDQSLSRYIQRAGLRE